MISTLIKIAREAGKIIEEEKKKNQNILYKKDNSPFTITDLKVNHFIVTELKKYFPDHSILSEESEQRVTTSSFFVVDPLDGTKEFIKALEDNKYVEYAVQIGYVQEGKPTCGVVYQSALDKLYYAEKGKGAFVRENGEERRITVKASNNIVIGRYNIDEDLKEVLKQRYKTNMENVFQGGSFGLKVCQVAEGIYGTFVHTNFDSTKIHASLWDSCAPDVILSEAGGRSFELKTLESVCYSPDYVHLTNGYIACANRRDKVLVFDVDGVLGDFEELRKKRDVAHIKAVAMKNNLSYDDSYKLFFETKQKLKALGKHSTIDTMQHLGISKEEFFEIMNSVPVEGGIVLTKNAKETLQQLAGKYSIVALTNTPYQSMIDTLEYLGLLVYFDRIYSIDKHDYVKPSTTIFSRILEDCNALGGFSIGDSVEKDLLPAKEVGLKTILFDRQEIVAGVDFKVDDLIEIVGVVDGD